MRKEESVGRSAHVRKGFAILALVHGVTLRFFVGEKGMENAWKTQWEEEGRRRYKEFAGDKPTPAVEFGKKLKLRGIAVVDVISVRRAFPPPLKHQTSPGPGYLWCPYCLKWRPFEESAVQYTDFYTPAVMRCPVCTISIKDAFVRMYNPELVIRYEMEMEMRQRRLEAAKAKKKAAKSASRDMIFGRRR